MTRPVGYVEPPPLVIETAGEAEPGYLNPVQLQLQLVWVQLEPAIDVDALLAIAREVSR